MQQTVRQRMGLHLRAIRESRGLTQAEVASRLGMTEGGYRAYEAGRSEPSFTNVPELARALGVEPSIFFDDAATQAASREEAMARLAEIATGDERSAATLLAMIRAVAPTLGPTVEGEAGERAQGKYNSQMATYGQVLVAAGKRVEGTQAYDGSDVAACEPRHRELAFAS